MGWDKKRISLLWALCPARPLVRRDDEDAAGSGIPDVDIALTTREIARMIDRAGIQFTELPDEEFDSPMGESTGASVIFGATGGVMEAALRTAAEWVGGKPLEQVEFTDVRGTAGVSGGQLPDRRPDCRIAVAFANEEAAGAGQARYEKLPLYRDHGLSRRLCQRRRPACPAGQRA